MKASETDLSFDVIPTGFSSLDVALGIGGIPTKKITECAGSWSVGKSTLALQIIAHAQPKHPCCFIDSEFSFTSSYAAELGVDNAKLELIREPYAEANLDALEKWANENKNALIVLDSVGSLLPKEEAEKGSESRSIGLQARLMGAFCRRIVPILDKQNNALIILNHTFTDLNTGRLKSSGGAKLEYARSVWLTMRRTFGKTAKRDKTGKRTSISMEIEVRKNKLANTEGTKCEIEFVPGQGFISQSELPALEAPKRGRPRKQ